MHTGVHLVGNFSAINESHSRCTAAAGAVETRGWEGLHGAEAKDRPRHDRLAWRPASLHRHRPRVEGERVRGGAGSTGRSRRQGRSRGADRRGDRRRVRCPDRDVGHAPRPGGKADHGRSDLSDEQDPDAVAGRQHDGAGRRDGGRGRAGRLAVRICRADRRRDARRPAGQRPASAHGDPTSG
jgi:hypothetical protein